MSGSTTPGYDLSFLSEKDCEVIARATPFRFHRPFAASGSPDFLEPFILIDDPERAGATLGLILTPPRREDLSNQVECLNDPAVAPQLIGPPFPYTLEMAQEWSEMRWSQTEDYFHRLQGAASGNEDQLASFGEPPFASIRDRTGGEWIGEIGVNRWEFREFGTQGNDDARDRLRRANDARRVGDPELVWSFGYYVSPRFHGQGIMTRVLSSMMKTVFVGLLRAGVVRGSAFIDNKPSIKVQERCGLVKMRKEDEQAKGQHGNDHDGEDDRYKDDGDRGCVRFWHQVSEGRGGGQREEIVLEWRRERPSE